MILLKIQKKNQKEQLQSVTSSVFSTIQNILVNQNVSQPFATLNLSTAQKVNKAPQLLPTQSSIWACYPVSLQGTEEEGKHQ